MSFQKKTLRIPIYLLLIITYLVLVLAVVVILSPVLSRAIELSKSNYMAEVEHSLDISTTLINNTFKEIYQLPAKLDDFNYYSRLKLSEKTPVSMESYGAIYMSNKALAKHFVTLEYIDEIFIYLPNNGVTFGKMRVFGTLREYLEFDLVYEDTPTDEVLRWIDGSINTSQVFPMYQARVQLGEPKQYMLTTMRRQGGGVVIGAAISEEHLQQLFSIPRLPKNCFLIITDYQGNSLYEYQHSGVIPEYGQADSRIGDERYAIISAYTELPALKVQLGVPESYFVELQKPLVQMVRSILLTAGAIALALSITFAMMNALPLRRLLRSGKRKGMGKPVSHIRELNDIGDLMHESARKIETLQSNVDQIEDALRSSILLQMLYGTVGITEQTLPARLLPETSKPYRVAVFTYDISGMDDSAEFAGYLMHAELTKRADQNCFIPGQISPYKSAVFISKLEGDLKAVKQLHDSLKRLDNGIQVTCGVSEEVTGKKNVGTAYRHALISLSQTEKGSFGVYDKDETENPQPVGFYGMHRLYNYLVAAEFEQADRLLRSIFNSMRKDQSDLIQVFFLVRFVLESVMSDGGLAYDAAVLPEYLPSMTDEDAFSLLRRQMEALVTKLESKRDSLKDQWKSEVLEYICSHVSDPELHADKLAGIFGVSPNLVYGLVREKTGKSLNEYIEQLRMKLAMELLKTTRYSIVEVAGMTGYYSQNTFYKAFKKNFGAPPSSVRG